MTQTYWQIGKYIVEYEQGGLAKVAYGTSTLTVLSQQLTARFGRGFSRPNLVNMRKFYLLYPNCQTVSDNLSWSHISELIKAEDNLERGFYEKECIAQKWDVRTLRPLSVFEKIIFCKSDLSSYLYKLKNSNISNNGEE